jgi:hypothetical protein
MAKTSWLRRQYVERHAAKGESWAVSERDRIQRREQPGLPTAWFRVTASYSERSKWGLVASEKYVVRTVVFPLAAHPRDLEHDLENEVFRRLHHANCEPVLGSIQYLDVQKYGSERDAQAGSGATR